MTHQQSTPQERSTILDLSAPKRIQRQTHAVPQIISALP